MAHVVLYIATSLDGYIARKNGAIDWLSIVDRAGEDYGYARFYRSVEAVVVGSKTYTLGLTFKDWPYPEKKCFVFTSRGITSDRADVEFLPTDVRAGVAAIEAQGFKRIWLVGGGALARAFLREALIDEFVVSIIPVLLGEGISLFPPPAPEAKLRLVGTSHYESGLVQVHYEKQA